MVDLHSLLHGDLSRNEDGFYSVSTESGNGIAVTFPFSFVGEGKAYLRESDIHIFIRDSDPASATYNELTEIIEEFSFPTENTVTMVTIIDSPIDETSNIIIRRIMPKDTTFANVNTDAVFRSAVLNNSFLQSLYVVHEALDGFLGGSGSLPLAVAELSSRVDRCLRVGSLDEVDTDNLIIPVDRVNKYMTFNTEGEVVMTSGTDGIPPDEVNGNLFWQGSFNVWQLGVAFDDFTSRADVMDGWSFARAASSDKEVLIIQQEGAVRLQRFTGDVKTDAWYLVGNSDQRATSEYAGKTIYLKTSIRGNGLTGNVSLRVQYTTYSDLQKITAFDGVYPVAHTTLLLQDVTPVSGTTEFQIFNTTVAIPEEATQIALCYIYEPTGTALSEEWFELDGVSKTNRPYLSLPPVPFETALRKARIRIKKSYAYSVAPRSVATLGALTAVSLGLDSLTDSVLAAEVEDMLYPPMVTIWRVTGGGLGATFSNETQGTELTALVSEISTRGFRLETSVKANAYENVVFEPVFGAVTANYTLKDGKGIRVGNQCSVDIEMEYDTLSLADTSDIQIITMPFGGSAKNGAGVATVNIVASTGLAFLATDTVIAGFHPTSGVTLTLSRSGGGNPIYDYNDGKMNASGTILMSCNFMNGFDYNMNTYSAQYELRSTI